MESSLLQWGFFLLSVGVMLYFAWQKPDVLPALLAGAVALEISVVLFPAMGFLASQLGSLARLFSVGIIGAAILQLWRDPGKRRELKKVLKHYLTWALYIYMAVAVISLSYTVDRGKTGMEIFRLFILFALYLGCRLLMEERTVLWPLRVVHGLGLALVPLALYEWVTHNLIWQEALMKREVVRVNATFVDPNIFARYLILGIIANLILYYLSKKNVYRILYLATLCALLGGLAATLSRSGLLTLAIVLFLLICLIPRKRMIWPVGLVGLAGGGILALQPAVWQRMSTLLAGLGALDEQRQYLWEAALAMFRDYPLGGVGLGGFQTMFLTKYIHLKTEIPFIEGATLSHTTVLTIAAELGIIGLVALAWFWLTLVIALLSLRRSGKRRSGWATEPGSISREERRGYIPGVGYFLWITAVFISSQAEGRFFEDPVIWLSLAVLGYLVSEDTNEKWRSYRWEIM